MYTVTNLLTHYRGDENDKENVQGNSQTKLKVCHNFEILRDYKVGFGSHGNVFSVKCNDSCEKKLSLCDPSKKYVVKGIEKYNIYENERSILEKIKGLKHIISLIHSWESPSDTMYYMVFEHAGSSLAFFAKKSVALYKQSETCLKMSHFVDLACNNLHHIMLSTLKLIVQQLHDALINLKTKGILHRDLKPENICFHKIRKHLTIVDFGIAIHTDETIKETHFQGTIPFLSPSHFRLENTHEMDEWSAIVVIYTLLCNNFPFGNTQVDVIRELNGERIVSVPEQYILYAFDCFTEYFQYYKKNPNAFDECVKEITERLNAKEREFLPK
jgi:serine/threonine protein kinase